MESIGASLGPRAPGIELSCLVSDCESEMQKSKSCFAKVDRVLNEVNGSKTRQIIVYISQSSYIIGDITKGYDSIEVWSCSMKRGREAERTSEMRSVIEELSLAVKAKQPKNEEEEEEACYDSAQLKVDAVHIRTKAFLAVCKFVLQVLDKIGPTMAVLRQDIHQNIQRLETLHDTQPELYSNLVEMLNKEKNEGNTKKKDSCSRAFVWLTRALDFTTAILRKLADEPEKTMEQAVEESYGAALKPWHGWISSAAYKVALKMVPDRKSLMTLLVIKDDKFENLVLDFQSFILLLNPLLDDAHNVMEAYGLSKFKSH